MQTKAVVGMIVVILLLAVLIGSGAAAVLAAMTRQPDTAPHGTGAMQTVVIMSSSMVITPAASSLPVRPTAIIEPRVQVELVSAAAPPTPTAETTNAVTKWREQLRIAIGQLRSGTFTTVIRYQNGSQRIGHVRFDLHNQAMFAATTSYQDASNRYTDERILTSDALWTRHNQQAWVQHKNEGTIASEVQLLLPYLPADREINIRSSNSLVTLIWIDDNATTCTLILAETDGTPRLFRKVKTGSGTSTEQTYDGWNAPVNIALPSENDDL